MSIVIGQQNGPCRLCGVPGRLCASHIVPEFHYKPLYGKSNPRAFHVTTSDLEEAEQKFQKGFREYLLCGKCETCFSVWEHKASEFYKSEPDRVVDGFELYEELDYYALKNYWNSLLWRLAVTSNHVWRGVTLLGFENELREMLKSGNPGTPAQYGCMLIRLRVDGKPEVGIMSPLGMGNLGKTPTANVLINGIRHIYSIPEIAKDNPYREHIIQQNGHLIVGCDDAEMSPAIADRLYAVRLATATRSSKRRRQN